MKSILNFALILVTVLFAWPAFSGGGGISGGSKMITVEVCELDMPGACRTLRYVDRFTDEDRENALHPKSSCLISVGEAQYLPCDETKTYEIPKFLKKLNEIFGGASAPPKFDPPN